MPSTINPSNPPSMSALVSALVRNNFAAAAADINNILSKFQGTSAPSNPSPFQYWLNSSATPNILNIFDGTVWVPIGQLDPVAHTWTALGTQVSQREILVSGNGTDPGTFLIGASSFTLQGTYGSLNNIEVHYDASYQGINQFTGLNGKVVSTASPLPAGITNIFVDGW